jgi:hypothetical protein
MNPAFSAYISAYTAGVVSSESVIQVRLAQEVIIPSKVGTETDATVFSFSPSIKGKTYWLDTRTLEFRPDERLPSGKQYEVEFYVSKVMDIPKDLGDFQFSFQTMIQNFEITTEGLKTYQLTDLKKQKLLGTFLTADVAVQTEVEKTLSAEQNGNKLAITWEHAEDKKTHRFVVENIQRAEKESSVLLKWNGSPIEADNTGDRQVEVPALGDFKLMEAKVIQNPDQYLSLQFSDPLLPDQDLNGLVRIEDNQDLRFQIVENEIRVYPQVSWPVFTDKQPGRLCRAEKGWKTGASKNNCAECFGSS